MNLFGVELRSDNKAKINTNVESTYSFEDEQLAKLMGIDIEGLGEDKAKEATFYTSIKILADSVSKLPLKLHGKMEVDTKHYLYNLLKLRPNPNMSSSVFWKTVEYQRSYYGHSVVVIDYHTRGKDAGKVKSLIPLDMQNVKILIDDVKRFSDDSNLYFNYKEKRTGREFTFKQSEVLHFMGSMTKDGITPMPVKDYLKTLIDNASASSSYTNNYLKNGLHSKGIIKYVGDIDERTQTKLQERMNRISGGLDKAGQIMPLPVGMDYQNITSSLADSQFTELQQLTIQQIASAFGVKLHQLNSADSSTVANTEQQQKSFYVDTMQTILTTYEQELTYKLLTTKELEAGYNFKFNVDAILRSQSKERAEYLKILVEGAIITANEARRILDYHAKDGADELIINGSYLPLADAVAGKNYVDKEVDALPEGGDIDEQ